ncbi:MAG TPA: hypothetical protein VEB42_00955 [Chitinophagaceae bacterium]|nr:hypothetical protein [Chitinophagaceae bacterium]
MQLETFSEVKVIAREKWREYRDAEKKEPDNKTYVDLRKMYWQIANGKKLVDINEVIKAGGVHKENYHPKLAIAKANVKVVRCTYNERGGVLFSSVENRQWRTEGYLSDVRCTLLPIPREPFLRGGIWNGKQMYSSELNLKAPVPLIPPKCKPKVITDEHYILWEVDVWQMVPPTDPYLLRRITKNIFAVEAQWDLTPLEKAAMAGRMH